MYQCHCVQVILLTGNQPHSLGALRNELAEVGTGIVRDPSPAPLALRAAPISLSLKK